MNYNISIIDPNGVTVTLRQIIDTAQGDGKNREERIALAKGFYWFNEAVQAREEQPKVASAWLNYAIERLGHAGYIVGVYAQPDSIGEDIVEAWTQLKDALGFEAVDWLNMTPTDLGDDSL